MLVGCGNSAGQAVVFLASNVARVYVLIRAEGLSATMSQSLADRSRANARIELHPLTDVATPMGFDRQDEGFAGTPTTWGVPAGAYLVWPLLGPSTVRDSVGIPVDITANPLSWVSSVPLRNEFIAVSRFVDQRAKALPLTNMIDDIALDKYLFVRDGCLQRHTRAERP